MMMRRAGRRAKEQKRELALKVEQMTHFSGDFDAAAPTERKRT